MKLPWFIPQERLVPETEDEINQAYKNLSKGNQQIIEYRDEAKRSWWNFFDEYEYRKNIPRWSWFGEGTSPEERKLLAKLDVIIVIYSMMGYWCKYFDSSNLTNAYVSGMKQDLYLTGNDLVDTQVMTTIGNCIFMLPVMYLLPRFPTTYLCFINEFGWSLFTLVTFTAKNVETLKVFRFFLGGFETAFFPIVHYTLSNFYKPSEISSRASLFYCGQFLGNLTSGLLQSSIYTHLNGANGLPGWKWMFIIDGIISFAVCFIGLFLVPGTPFKCYSIWLTDDDIKLARRRMRENQTDDGLDMKSFLDWDTWKKMLKSWHLWVFGIAGAGLYNASASGLGQFALWLQSQKKYTVSEVNNLTAIQPALGIAYVIIICFLADITQKRFGMIIMALLINLVSVIILAVWDVSLNLKWFAYYIGYWAWTQSPIFYPLVNDVLRHDANLKGIEWNVIYLFGLQSYAWVSILAWKTVEAPRFTNGFITAASMSALEIVFVIIAYFFYKSDERKSAAEHGILLFNSDKGESPPVELLESESEDSDLEKRVDEIVLTTKNT